MAMTPHKTYGANSNTVGGLTPDSVPMVTNFNDYTVRGPATITRIVVEAQFIQSVGSGTEVITPADYPDIYAYTVNYTQVATGNTPAAPVDSPLFDPTNDIMHVGLLYKDTSPGIPTMKMSHTPIVIETQRKVPSGQDATLFLVFSATNEVPPPVQLICNAVYFVAYLT